MIMTITKSVATVTGASQGIGRATAPRLARDFSVIVLVARDEDKLDAGEPSLKVGRLPTT